MLSLPFYLAPRPAAALRADGALNVPLGQSDVALTLRGQGVATPAYKSRVWALELHESNVNDYVTRGIQESGDMKYIGVGSNVTSAGALRDDTLIYFGIATFGPWSTATLQDTWFTILIDNDNDLVADFLLMNWNLVQARGGSDASDTFVAAVLDLEDGERVVSTHPINALATANGGAPYYASALVLPVAAGDLGLKPGKSRINYQVIAYAREVLGPSDFSTVHSFDPAAPALSLGAAPLIDGANGTSAQVRINRTSWMRDEVQGVLLLHELNAAPTQAEVVPVTVGFRQTFLPWVGR
jgi:hypothetical protein